MKTVKLISILALVAVIALPSCRSKKSTPERAAIEEPARRTEVVTPAQDPEVASIPARTERFSFENVEDRETHQKNEFFVILGSFRDHNNAERFKTTLSRQGFNPIILISETGFHRVSVNAYTDEYQARVRVQQVRSSFPEYHDAWLLIRAR